MGTRLVISRWLPRQPPLLGFSRGRSSSCNGNNIQGKIFGSQSSVALSKHHRGARRTACAPNFFVCRLAWVSGGCTRWSLPAMQLALCLSSPCGGSRKRRD
jgi:hypothetical protein